MKIDEISLKKLENISQNSNRPKRILSNFTKVFGRIIIVQLNDYMENKFSEDLPGFRTNHNTQNSLLRMLEYWKARLGNSTYLNIKVPQKKKSLVEIALHKELVNFGKVFLNNLEIHFIKTTKNQ